MSHIILLNILISLSQINPSKQDTINQSSVITNQDITIIESDVQGISFRYSFEDDQLEQQQIRVDDNIYTVFDIKGTGRKEQVGNLDLPSMEVMIGIPQQGDIAVFGEPVAVKSFKNIEIAPVPYRTWENEPKYNFRQEFKSDLIPENVCEVVEIGYFRDIRIARIKINPVQYNHLSKQAIVNSDIIVHIRFSQPAQEYNKFDYFDGIANEILLNNEQAKNWKSPMSFPFLESGQSRYPQGFLNWYKVKIDTTGLYKITQSELKQAGVPINLIDPRTIRLFNIGDFTSNTNYPDTMTEIPIYISGENDSIFNKNDYILFFGVAPSRYNKNRSEYYNNPFTLHNYYWLTWGISANISGLGKRMDTIISSQQGTKLFSAENYVHLEKDRDCPARSGLLWIWELYAKALNAANKSFDLSLELQNPESLYSISGRFYGQTPSNWMKITLNNVMLDSNYFSGGSTNPPAFNFLINRKLALNDTNTISFTLYNTPEQDIFLDFLKIRYRQSLEFLSGNRDMYFYKLPGVNYFAVRKIGNKPFILDISDYYSPKMFKSFTKNRDTIFFGTATQETTFYFVSDETKARKIISIEQRNPGQTVNYTNIHYFIITPDELYSSALLFENYRQNNIAGITQARVKAVKLTQIYDDFTFGIEEPGAIKRLFKKYRPYYGLLLGDGTYDYRNILQLSTFPQVPAYEYGYDIDFQVYSDFALALEVWYSDFEGSGSTPDMALGRITARTNTEVRQFYEKLANYESKRSFGFWNKRFILLADDEWKKQGIIDEFVFPYPEPNQHIHYIDHVDKCEGLENSLYYSTANKFRHLEPVKVYLTEYPFSAADDKQKARAALLAELNKGASLWCYFGHGAGFQLCHEQALHISHIPLIHSERRNFIAFFGSCGVGRFEDTKYESISEELVRKEDAAIATMGATKATDSGSNFGFANAFFNLIISQPESTIGRAFMTAIRYNYKYCLFGDPATVPSLPNQLENINSSPDTFRTAQISLNSGQATSSDLFSASSYSSKWHRYYEQPYNTLDTIKIHYNLSGYELFRGLGRAINDSIKFHFMVPTGLPRGFRYDIISGGGSYTEIDNSSRISAIAYSPQQNKLISLLKDSIPFDTIPALITDFTGPQIMFYNEDKRIKPSDVVPKQFTLSVKMSDSSGILIAPMSNYNPRLIIKKRPNQTIEDVDVTSYFTYDINNFDQGQISYPVTLDTGECVIIVKTADNLKNLTTDSVIVNVQKSQKLEIDKVLYYSASGNRTSYFTFTLSQPAVIGIKIYTINGRLVKTLNERLCNFGYNQIVWDGLDDDRVIPSNGVYLYKISASSYTSSREERKSAIDKFIILH